MVIEKQIQELLRETAESAADNSELEHWQTWLELAASAWDGRPLGAAALPKWSPQGATALLDLAATMVARHPDWQGSEQDARGWMTMLTSSGEIARQLGSEPRVVHHQLMSAVVDQARIQGQVIQAVWRESMLNSGAAAEALGSKPDNRERVRQERLRSALLGLPQGARFLYPQFQFDRERRRIFPEVEELNRRLDALGDPWGVASWWVGHHDRLGARPMDLVGTARSYQLPEVADALFEPIG
ncbi:MAG: hypothetical protein OXI41_01770 [Chloroflexota bacterium]|nr:hypothetical protein [Chloroflexota bacterium]MDE2894194.1 hypothetical protein [Chloroflexota bacterium]